jgi:hypothetical protein
MLIQRVCAWCGRFLGTKESQYQSTNKTEVPISHGICSECREKVLAEIKPNS